MNKRYRSRARVGAASYWTMTYTYAKDEEGVCAAWRGTTKYVLTFEVWKRGRALGQVEGPDNTCPEPDTLKHLQAWAEGMDVDPRSSPSLLFCALIQGLNDR
eukprot:scaffold478515_cov41-Prasinocladus_malaysianus.AAC.1